MNNEIERRFLVKELPEQFEQFPHADIIQGYIALDRGFEVRLRRYGRERFLAVKTKRERNVRVEHEIPLTREQFEELWPTTAGRRLQKIRYRVPWNTVVIEVDVYRGDATGLIIAEVEFSNEESRAAFQKPPWLGKDVSGVKRYSNHFLASQAASSSSDSNWIPGRQGHGRAVATQKDNLSGSGTETPRVNGPFQ